MLLLSLLELYVHHKNKPELACWRIRDHKEHRGSVLAGAILASQPWSVLVIDLGTGPAVRRTVQPSLDT